MALPGWKRAAMKRVTLPISKRAPVRRQRPRVTTPIRQLAGGFDDTPARNQIETSRGFLLESIAIEWVAIVNGVGSGEWVDAASRSTNSWPGANMCGNDHRALDGIEIVPNTLEGQKIDRPHRAALRCRHQALRY